MVKLIVNTVIKFRLEFLLCVLFLNMLSHVVSTIPEYQVRFDPNYWTWRYEHSQWVSAPSCARIDPHINPNTCVWDDSWYALHGKEKIEDTLGDDGLYTYAAWQYIHGKDPTLLNAEMPPLGKYLLGVFLLVFKSPALFGLATGLLCLALFYKLTLLIIKDRFWALVPVTVLSMDSLFLEQLRAPFFDLLYLLLLILAFILLIKKNYAWSLFVLGLFAATKSPFVVFLAILAFAAYLFFSKRKDVSKFLILMPITLFSFMATYTQFFLLGHSIRSFLGVQKWIWNFYSGGVKVPIGGVFPMIIGGWWRTWWDGTIRVGEWNIFWLLGFVAFILIIFVRGERKKVFSIWIWSLFYLIFLSNVAVWPRYLLMVLPFFYTILTVLVRKAVSRVSFK